MNAEWTFNPIFNYGAVSAASLLELAVLGLSFIWAAQAALSRVQPPQRAILFAVRLLVILLLIFAMLRPTLVITKQQKQSATLVLLLDRTRSMLVADAFAGKTRWDALKQTVLDAAPELKELTDDVTVKVYTFDSQIMSVDLGEGKLDLGEDPPAGSTTAIGQAMEEVRKLHAANRLAGVVLLSDGAQQAFAPYNLLPQDAARRLAEIGCPLYTVTFGQANASAQGRDVAVKNLPDDLDVFVKNKLNVSSILRVTGLANQNVPVEMLFETEAGKPLQIVDRAVAKPDKDDFSQAMQMSYVPLDAGERKLTVRAPVQSGELVVSNNELSTFVTVRKGGLNVLYLEGEPRVEQRFLRRSLNASPDIKVDYQWFDHRDRKNWPLNLGDVFQPGKYDVYIIGDLDASAFRPADLGTLRTTVENGAGLLMLGGFHTFWGGGYLASPLAPILPLREDAGHSRLRKQAFDEPLRRDLHLQGPLSVVPSPKFGNLPFVMLGTPETNAKAWASLPQLDGANDLFELKDNAKVLLETANGKPLLVANELRVGRALAFAGDSTWHWWMQGHDVEHKRFWRQLVLWLARKDDVNENDVWIKLDKRRYHLGERVDFTAGARTAQGAAVADAEFDVAVLLPDGKRQPLKLTREGESMLGNFLETKALGDYTIEATARQGAKQLGSRRARFLTFDQDLELEEPAARPALMELLAKTTEQLGGRAVAPEQLVELFKEIKQHPPELLVQQETKLTPWDSWPFFLWFVLLLCIEWFLRKRWGLV